MEVSNGIEKNGEQIKLNASEVMYKDENEITRMLPFGIIVESGENENGSYVKFGNGWMLCVSVVTLTYTSTVTIDYNWRYPASFIAKPFAFGNSAESSGVSHRGLSPYFISDSISNTRVLISRIQGTTDFAEADTRKVNVFAIGKWKE